MSYGITLSSVVQPLVGGEIAMMTSANFALIRNH